MRNSILYASFFVFCLMLTHHARAANDYSEEGNQNPLLPGYFADPTIKKFGDTYYLYVTTDGVKLASGEPTVWLSKDFKNWYCQEMDIDLPEGLTNCWAPDVVEQNGKYYYYMGNCQFGCNIYAYVSDNPVGPWKAIKKGEPVIPVGTGKEHLPALDAQFFTDDDGTLYSHFGTWCTSFGGVGWAEIDANDMTTIVESGLIPIEQLPHAFEASYMIKRNGKYILMYSSGDCKIESYAVHYAWADSPTGPFHYGANNPILSTNADASIDGPGHHSILKEDDDYYMLYHRHDNPHSTGGMFRQTCADKMEFLNDTTIATMNPTHNGVGALVDLPHFENLALGAKAGATSEYHLQAPVSRYNKKGVDHLYKAAYASDDNNGTLWKAASAQMPQSLVIDLGQVHDVQRVMIQFEYASYYYQYKIESATDESNWVLFADQTANRTSASPTIDDHAQAARYLKITITGTEKTGMYPAIWNVKVYDELFPVIEVENKAVATAPAIIGKGALLVDFDTEKLKTGKLEKPIINKGKLKGSFNAIGSPEITQKEGQSAMRLDGKSYLELDRQAPETLNWNAPFTVAATFFAEEIPDGKCIVAWNARANMLQASYAALMYGKANYGAMAHGDGAVDLPFKSIPEAGKWHTMVVSFDGMNEKVYVDGQLNTQMPLMLFVEAGKIRIGASGMPTENFEGYIGKVKIYDGALSEDKIVNLFTK
ncbi:family 43 glycosylhydrolase [Roseimarinus sediminis]|uniref:family 43 glycosylhydrolase n=1 Tax=Roseimarinus sediminis TaxID=1610899 RepID=UPI003D1F4C1C